MPERRQLDFHSFEEFSRDVRKLRDRGYERAGNWTLAQNCDHLRLFIDFSLNGFPFKLPLPMRLAGPLLKRRTLSTRKLPTGVKAPPALMPSGNKCLALPKDANVDSEAANRLIETIDRYLDFKGTPQPSPLFGRIDRETWDQLHLIHASHHLSFLVPKNRKPSGMSGRRRKKPEQAS